jgi:4-diphosphocytidyl-2-C-methyl-D-erythritol kinase
LTDAPTFGLRPPAKINLTLEVVGRRPDGYHELRSVFLRVGLTDRLTVKPGGADGSDTLTITGLPGVPVRDNLVLRAAEALRGRLGVELPTLDFRLEKNIPAAAGLGGGSSDCASALKLALVAWGVGLSEAEELELAAELGSDVPFFVSGLGEALVEGRGERVSPSSVISGGGVLLFTPPIALRTAAVFDRFDHLALPRLLEGEAQNDLWPAAASLAPTLPALREELERATGKPWLMSGSGPTLFALYPSASEAAEAGQGLAASQLPSIDNALINAVDLVGPDPAWRYP